MNLTEKQIEYVLDFTDFEKIQKAMQAMDWTWVNSAFGVPQVWELKSTARKMLTRVVSVAKRNGAPVSLETGGFTAFYNPEEDFLELKFVLDSSDNHFYSEDYFEDDFDDADEEEVSTGKVLSLVKSVDSEE